MSEQHPKNKAEPFGVPTDWSEMCLDCAHSRAVGANLYCTQLRAGRSYAFAFTARMVGKKCGPEAMLFTREHPLDGDESLPR